MGMPQHPEFTPINQQSGWSPLRLGLVIFIAVFLAIIASCASIYYYSVNSAGKAVSDWRQERDQTPKSTFWKDYNEGGVRR